MTFHLHNHHGVADHFQEYPEREYTAGARHVFIGKV